MDVLKQTAQDLLDVWDIPFGFQPAKANFEAPRAALAQPERKPLTEEEIELAYREIWRDLSDGFRHTSAEWIEAGIRYAEKIHGIE